MTMVSHLPAIFSLLVGAAGWFYLFYSRAGAELATMEAVATNRLRVRLRRIGGFAMILLAVSFYVGMEALEQRNPTTFVGFMIAVLLLLCAIIVLGLVDLHLTNRLRRYRHKQDRS
jgi:hypothetical protein